MSLPDLTTAPLRPAARSRVRIGFIILAELVALIVIASVSAPVLVTAAVAVAGAAILILTLPGRGGAQAMTRLARRQLMRARQHRTRHLSGSGRIPDPRSSVLGQLAPTLSVRTADGPSGPLGIGHDDGGWFAAAEVRLHQGLVGDPTSRLDLGALATMTATANPPLTGVQLVIRTRRPASGDAACILSYRELTGGDDIAVDQQAWLAVRIGLTEAAAVIDDPTEIDRCLGFALARGIRTLRRGGVPATPLDGAGLLSALADTFAVPAGPTDAWPAQPVTAEHLGIWAAGPLSHATYVVTRWPVRTDPRTLPALALAPAVDTTASLVLSPHRDGVTVECLIRLTAPLPDLPEAARRLAAAGHAAGVDVHRFDGQQAKAAYATTPSGGAA